MTTPVTPTPPPADGSAPQPSAEAPPAPAAAPGPLAKDTADALQRALQAQHMAIWAYGVVAANSPDDNALITEIRDGHLVRRDATTARLVAGGATPIAPAPAYKLPEPVGDPASARKLGMVIESDCTRAWRAVIGSTDDAELRGFALAGLSDSAVRWSSWKVIAKVKPPTVAFPGQD